MSREGSKGCAFVPMRHLAGIEGMKAGQHLEQRGLAAARGPDQRHEFARLDVEGRLGDREKIRAARAVDLLHAGQVDERFAHGFYDIRL